MKNAVNTNDRDTKAGTERAGYVKCLLFLLLLTGIRGYAQQSGHSPGGLSQGQPSQIEVSAFMDSCIDLSNQIHIGNESMQSPSGMTIHIRNASPKDYWFRARSFWDIVGGVDANGKKLVRSGMEEPPPSVQSDSVWYLVRAGQTTQIHVSTGAFRRFKLEKNMRYSGRLKYLAYSVKYNKYGVRHFPGEILSAPFQFQTCE